MGTPQSTFDKLGDKTSSETFPFVVQGLSCSSCIERIESAFRRRVGIVEVEVNFATQRGSIRYLPDVISIPEIQRIASDLGYTFTPLGSLGERSDETARRAWLPQLQSKLGWSVVLSLVIMFLSMQAMLFGEPPLSATTTVWLLWILATPVQFWAGGQFHHHAFRALKNKTADMNTLISLGTNTAYFYSVYLTLFPPAHFQGEHAISTYYDTSAMIITFVLLGRFLEEKAKTKTREALHELLKLQPQEALVVKEGYEEKVPIARLHVGDMVLVKPGEKIPADGIVVEGITSIDESPMTGESLWVDKKPGDHVLAGTFNCVGIFTFKVEQTDKNTVLAQVIRCVEQAQNSKAPIQRLVDKVAAVFVPGVVGIALLTFILWFLFASANLFNQGLVHAISVLLIACPCALGLATPVAVMVGIGAAAKRGLLVKESRTLETLSRVDTVVFDKTGTLTHGRPEVTDIVATEAFHIADVLAYAASAEKHSEHALARAVLEKCMHVPADPEEFAYEPGLGISALVRKKPVLVGNLQWMQMHGVSIESLCDQVEKFTEEGKTVVFVAVEDALAGIIVVSDTLRADAKDLILWIRMRAIEVVMLTGDNARTAKTLAQELGIKTCLAEVLPQNKALKIQALQAQGKVVAMVGDGINDAPALAQADVGIAVHGGVDSALKAADVVLVKPDLLRLQTLLELSRRTVRIIRQNLFWAFFYNVLLIPVAAGVLQKPLGLSLQPELAALLMSFSSLTVVGNALRLKR